VVDYILWKKMARDARIKKLWDREKIDYQYGVFGLCEHGGVLYAPVLGDNDLNPSTEGEMIISGGEVDDVLQSIKSIGLNLMILLQEYPEYIATQTVKTNPAGRGFGSGKTNKQKSLGGARVIGSDFNIRRESDNIATRIHSPNQGQASTKKPHFRRGHWRRQRRGIGLTDHHYIWIKPKFINMDTA
jgi:hypothetical protein